MDRIQQIRTYIKIAPQDTNTYNLLQYLDDLTKEINGKKYGLVFEQHREEIDEKLDTHTPVLIEQKELFIDNGGVLNFLIEGDNLAALKLLEKTHKGNIDVIYIDPPYNTGAADWKYNNNYVDKNDTFRHSKWLCMMKARLEIAKGLLKSDGALICAIDENELSTTILLLEELFGIGYKIDPITVIHNPRGVQGDNFSYVNEYALFVYKRGSKIVENTAVEESDIDWSPLRNWGTESERHDAANCFYPILVKEGNIIGFGDDVTDNKDFHPKQTEYDPKTGIYSIYPIDIQGVERKWRYARQSVEGIVHLLRVKETDRIDTTCRQLEKLNCKLEEFEDGMSITGGVTGGVVDSCGDHRLAMAFSLIGLKYDIEIDNGEVFDVSFPNFIEAMAEIGLELELV